MLETWQSILTALGSLVMVPTVAKTIFPTFTSPKRLYNVVVSPARTMDDFMADVKHLFEAPLSRALLLDMSSRMQQQYKQRLLQSDAPCMLPSFNHTLPTGAERGTYLALDVGGSTFRVALVELRGQESGDESMAIVKMNTYPINNSIKSLKGRTFFDWMAERIEQTLAEPEVKEHHKADVLPMGLAWSFPIIETSIRSGKLAQMGKGFEAIHGCEGLDLTELIMASCQKRGLKVSLDAIVNDSSATLLSRAYRDSATRIALILGTGTNAAIHLPVTALAPAKFGERPQSWHDEAKHVLINTEMSMFGKHVLQTTKWDYELNQKHSNPDFQPFEYLISGRYISEITRLIMVDAIRDASLFDGKMPDGLATSYNFDASIMATFESDETPMLSRSAAAMQKAHPLSNGYKYHRNDLYYVRQICQLVTRRAAAYLAVAIHALWSLRLAEEGLRPNEEDHITIGCNGSVIEKYPGFRENAQRHLNELCILSGGHEGSIVLDIAVESAIYGAAVAVCCLEGQS